MQFLKKNKKISKLSTKFIEKGLTKVKLWYIIINNERGDYLKNHLLLYEINKRGFSVSSVSESIGMSPTSLYNRIRGDVEFRVTEIDSITQLLNLTSEERDSIFFANTVADMKQ